MVKSPDDSLAYDTALGQQQIGENEVWILLVQDAVYTPPSNWDNLYVCHDDLSARGVNCPGIQVGYGEMVDLLFKVDTVVNW